MKKLHIFESSITGHSDLSVSCSAISQLLSLVLVMLKRSTADECLRRDPNTPLSISLQMVSVAAVPIVQQNTFITDIEYSPLIGGFAVVFNDGKAAFLTASSLKFDPNVSYLDTFGDEKEFSKVYSINDLFVILNNLCGIQ